MITNFRFTMAMVLMTTMAFSAQASQRIDYDIDDNGLIEIEDLQDLNEIRNNKTADTFELRGETLYGVSDGCPIAGCTGYELVTDLNFDTNGNGAFDDGDSYWNEGKGWDPIGSEGQKYVTEFHGNGHTLHNLTIRRPGDRFVGLFSFSELAYLHDFKLTADIVSGSNSGGIVGMSRQTTFENLNLDVVISADKNGEDCNVNICGSDVIGGMVGIGFDNIFKQLVVKALVTGANVPNVAGVLGGLAGDITGGSINEIAIQGVVIGSEYIGGLSGFVDGTHITSVVAITELNGSNYVGGLIGRATDITLSNVLVSGVLNTGIGLTKEASGGGLIGQANSDVEINSVISLVKLPSDPGSDHYIGALTGSDASSTVSNVVWARDLSLRDYMFGSDHAAGPGQTFYLGDIKCASDSDTQSCNGLNFNDFGEQLNSLGEALWEFGGIEDAPVMVLAMGTFGDKDGNGEVDDWPATINQDPRSNSGQANKSDSSGLGGVFYLLLFLMPFVFRRR